MVSSKVFELVSVMDLFHAYSIHTKDKAELVKNSNSYKTKTPQEPITTSMASDVLEGIVYANAKGCQGEQLKTVCQNLRYCKSNNPKEKTY